MVLLDFSRRSALSVHGEASSSQSKHGRCAWNRLRIEHVSRCATVPRFAGCPRPRTRKKGILQGEINDLDDRHGTNEGVVPL